MALSSKQLQTLKGMPGIDQKLVAAYEKGGSNLNTEERAYVESKAPSESRLREIASKPFVSVGNKKSFGAAPSIVTTSGKGEKVEAGGVDVDPTEAVDRITNFNKALNTGIDMARQQRQDTVLDLVGGFAGEGNLPASSFASVLNSFNNSSAPLEASLMKSATDFAADQEKVKADTKNDIRNLALSIATETGDTTAAKMISALAESGNMEAAMEAALTAYGEDYIRDGNTIVKTGTKEGEDDQVVFQYDAGSQTVDGDGKVTKTFTGRDDSLKEEAYVDYTDNKIDMEREVEPVIVKHMGQYIADTIEKSLTNKNTRIFLNDYLEWTTATGQYWDPEQYLKDWMGDVPIK